MCADRERAVEILRHLLSNALKFTPRGGAVTVGCEEGAGIVRFVVADTGRGIPEGQRDAIFQPFVQVEKGLTRSADGSGLGLAIARELAERMGGSLTVTSEVGAGSRFVLSLVRATEDGPLGAIECFERANIRGRRGREHLSGREHDGRDPSRERSAGLGAQGVQAEEQGGDLGDLRKKRYYVAERGWQLKAAARRRSRTERAR